MKVGWSMHLEITCGEIALLPTFVEMSAMKENMLNCVVSKTRIAVFLIRCMI